MKFIEKFIFISVGALLVAFIATYFSLQYSSRKERDYRSQLKSTIDEKYLDGKDVIGALLYEPKESIRINEVSAFDFTTDLSWINVRRETVWNVAKVDNTGLIVDVLRCNKYNWYDFNDCTTTSRPLLIVVKKTVDGYDIIGEYILGVALTPLYPNMRIRKKIQKIGNGDFIEHYISTDIANQYVQYLITDKYKNVDINCVTMSGDNGSTKNPKYEQLNKLVMQSYCPADSSLWFRVNKYFELKDRAYDDWKPDEFKNSTYADNTQTLYTQTITMHYRIEGNQDILEKEEKENLAWVLICSESIYLFLLLSTFKKNRKRRK